MVNILEQAIPHLDSHAGRASSRAAAIGALAHSDNLDPAQSGAVPILLCWFRVKRQGSLIELWQKEGCTCAVAQPDLDGFGISPWPFLTEVIHRAAEYQSTGS